MTIQPSSQPNDQPAAEFAASFTGTCDSCCAENVPVMGFRDEYGTACCEPCYVEGIAWMASLSDEERAELERVSRIVEAHHAE